MTTLLSIAGALLLAASSLSFSPSAQAPAPCCDCCKACACCDKSCCESGCCDSGCCGCDCCGSGCCAGC